MTPLCLKNLRFALSATLMGAICGGNLVAADLDPRVEVEEDVYSFDNPNNGSGPTWCHGNTCIVRAGDRVFASGISVIPGAKPLNNCLPLLFERTDHGWTQIFQGKQRTREPCPLTVLPNDQRVYLSINPTLAPPDAYTGPARPGLLEFAATEPEKQPVLLSPVWDGQPKFTAHSYRSFVADGNSGEMILFQNTGHSHLEWSFRDSEGNWSVQGQLVWPWGAEYDKPQPIRVCYPTVALKDRQVFFCGVSDIVEPYHAWREYKRKLTGREWDYDFRRLFFTWSDDIATGEFHDWVEISSRDKTCGWIFPRDLYVAPHGDVFVLWSERAIDERLREKFFPQAKQRYSLFCAILRQGKIIRRIALEEGGEGLGGLRPKEARFQVTEDGRLFVFYYVQGKNEQGQSVSENRLVELDQDGNVIGKPIPVQLEQPQKSFFTATVRAGCRPSHVLEIFGDVGGTMRYARIRLW